MRFRRATAMDLESIWRIFSTAIRRLGEAGIDQWQHGYPNRDVIREDIHRGRGWVIEEHDHLVAYGAVIVDGEPAYEQIEEGRWLSESADYLVVHRLCVDEGVLGMGYGLRFMEEVEEQMRDRFGSFRVDTHPDNRIMHRFLSRLGFTRCGLITIDGDRFEAFEKPL